jgi:hypothetical protein
MRNGSTNWDALDDGFGVVADDDEGVEYVGVVEEESTVPMGSNGVLEPARRVRSTIARAPYGRRAPVAQPAPEPVAPEPIRVATASGAVTLNSDAVRQAAKAPLQRMGDHAVRRAAPGTYLVMQPTNYDRMGMGTNGGFDWGGLISGVLETGAEVTGTALRYQSEREQRRAEAEARRIAAETAATEAAARRQSESERAQREFELQMERIRSLREAGRESEAQQLEQRLPAAPPSGPSPVVWVLVALLGAGAIGAVVWGVTRKSDKD